MSTTSEPVHPGLERNLVRRIVGEEQFDEIFVRGPVKTCAWRYVKGLYSKANFKQVARFTGKESVFEEGE